MRKLFFSLLVFIFVVCFFFIPHGAAIQPAKAEFSIMGICQDNSQMSLINLNLNQNYLLCETTQCNGQSTLSDVKVSALPYGITGYKAIKPWRSFHAGK